MSSNVVAETQQIKEQGMARLEELCGHLLPAGKKKGTHWRCGNVNGDKGDSFDVNLSTAQFCDFADGEKAQTGAINLWMAVRDVDFNTARTELAEWLGMHLSEVKGKSGSNGAFNWPECVKALESSDALLELQKWRGLSPKFCEWMISRKLIGLIYGSIAFPIYDKDGRVSSPHYVKLHTKDWLYFKGTHVSPLIVGNLKEDAQEVHIHESTWDGLTFADRAEAYLSQDVCVVITRGSKHTKALQGIIPSGRRVYVWPQNDKPDMKTGKIASEDWFRDVKEILEGSFYRAQTPPEFEDLNDWTRHGATKADIIDAITGATLFEKEDPLAWLKPKRVSELTIVQPDQMLRGILYQACKMVLMAGSKSFKTWTLMDIAYCVANGLLWWGVHTKQCPVFYLDWELLDFDFRWRMEQIQKAHGKGSIELVHRFGLRNQKIGAEHWSRIYEYMREGNAGLALADPTYKLLDDRDENKTGDIAQVTAIFDKLTQATGASIIYAQHFSKGNQAAKESIDRGAGSGVWARDADAIVTMTKHKQGDDYLSVEHTLRSFPRIDPFVVKWNCPLFLRQDDLDPGDLKQPPSNSGREKSFTVNDLMDSLGNKQFTTSEFLEVFVEKKKSSPATFHRLLALAKKDGLIHKCAIDQKWEKVSKPR